MMQGDPSNLDPMAPTFEVFIEDEKMQSLADHVLEVRVEQTVEMADKISLTLANDGNRFTDSPLFNPGVEISVWMGYGTAMFHIGRAELIRHIPVYPGAGEQPVLNLVAYGRDYRMGERQIRVTGGRQPTKADKEAGRIWQGTYAQIVTTLLREYGIEADVDELYTRKSPPQPALQRKGTSDADFIRSLARLAGAEFFVTYLPSDQHQAGGKIITTRSDHGILFRSRDRGRPMTGNVPGKWYGFFRKPRSTPENPHYRFDYSLGDSSAVLSASLDFSTMGAATEIQVLYYDKAQSDWVELSVSDDAGVGKPTYVMEKTRQIVPNWKSKAIRDARAQAGNLSNEPLTQAELDAVGGNAIQGFLRAPGERERTVLVKKKVRGAKPSLFGDSGKAWTETEVGAEGEITHYTPLKLAANGYSLDLKASQRFRTAAEAIAFAEDWFRRNKERLVSLEAETLGVTGLRAGSIHAFAGLGSRYSGNYYMATVEHVMTRGSGYTCNIQARKVIA